MSNKLAPSGRLRSREELRGGLIPSQHLSNTAVLRQVACTAGYLTSGYILGRLTPHIPFKSVQNLESHFIHGYDWLKLDIRKRFKPFSLTV